MDGKELRAVVRKCIHRYETGDRDITGTGAHGGPCSICEQRAEAILTEIVTALGITREMASEVMAATPWVGSAGAGDRLHGASIALTALLDAAEAP